MNDMVREALNAALDNLSALREMLEAMGADADDVTDAIEAILRVFPSLTNGAI